MPQRSLWERVRSNLVRWAILAFRWCSRSNRGLRVLLVDAAVPSETTGAGHPRAKRLVDALAAIGAEVTVWAGAVPAAKQTSFRMAGGQRWLPSDADQLALEARWADAVIVSRPPVMQRYGALVEAKRRRGAPLIYDAEAIFAMREVARRRLLKLPGLDEAEASIAAELDLARTADRIIAVSESEADAFRSAGHRDVSVVSYASSLEPTPSGFERRRDFLFVGPVYGADTPNGDSLEVFASKVLPLIRRQVEGVRLRTVGHALADLPTDDEHIDKAGAVDDLAPFYNEARVFVAPTRFAAGIPLKVIDAAAAGLPVVMTSLLASQLGWRDGTEALVADEPEGFAAACVRLYTQPALWRTIREGALGAVARDFSHERFRASVADLLRDRLR